MTTGGRLFCMAYALIGIPICMLAIANIGKFLAEAFTYVMEYSQLIIYNVHEQIRGSVIFQKLDLNGFLTNVLPEFEEPPKIGAQEANRDRPTPIGWLLFIAVLYLCVAAAILPLWENLDFFTAFYFSFITITTTGKLLYTVNLHSRFP